MIDKEKVMKQTEEAAQRSGKFRYLKKNATTSLRILEYEDDSGSSMFAQIQSEHRKAGSSGKSIGVCRNELFGEPCAYCKVNALASDKGKERPFITRSRYVVNAVDVNDSKPQVRLWVLPTSVFDDLAHYALSDDWSDIFEPRKGVVVDIKREGTGLETEYSVVLRRKSYPIGKDLVEQIVDPISEIKDPGLESQCHELNCEVSDLFENDELEIASRPKTTPKKESKKSGGTKPKSEEKEEDFMEIGMAVRYQDEEDVCHITAINGDERTIEDSQGEEYDVNISDLHAVKEKTIKVGDSVHYQDEKTICLVTELKKDGTILIRDSSGEIWEATFDDLTVEEDDVPFEEKSPESDDEKPNCFGDENLYDEDDKECKNCDYFDSCGTQKPTAGKGKSKSKKTDDDSDDVVSSIIGK